MYQQTSWKPHENTENKKLFIYRQLHLPQQKPTQVCNGVLDLA